MKKGYPVLITPTTDKVSFLKKITPLIFIATFPGCAFLDQFIPEDPPMLIDFGYPQLMDIPASSFEMSEDGRLLATTETILDLGRNTAACLDTVEKYSQQVSTYNEIYGKEAENGNP